MSLAREHIIYIFQLFMELRFSPGASERHKFRVFRGVWPRLSHRPLFQSGVNVGMRLDPPARFEPDQGQAGMPSRRCWSSQLRGSSLASRSSLDGARSKGFPPLQLRSIAQVAEEETDAVKASIFYGRLIRISPASPQEGPLSSNC
jgi:hypothetical protein